MRTPILYISIQTARKFHCYCSTMPIALSVTLDHNESSLSSPPCLIFKSTENKKICPRNGRNWQYKGANIEDQKRKKCPMILPLRPSIRRISMNLLCHYDMNEYPNEIDNVSDINL